MTDKVIGELKFGLDFPYLRNMVAHGGDKARVVKTVEKLPLAHQASLREADFHDVGGEAAYDIDLLDGADSRRIAAAASRTVRPHCLRHHDDRQWLIRSVFLGMKR